jgi:type IV secretion system protein VirD4
MDYTTQRSPYSRWASEAEIKESLFKIGLNDENPRYGGIPLFADEDSVYIDGTDTHSLIVGSTGSKKTRLVGMPALNLYARAGESFITTDPKAELYEKTFPLLKKNDYQIFVLNLRDPIQSNCWNPLLVPYRLYRKGQQDKAIELVTDMANCMVKEDYVRDPYWQNSAADLLTGLILTLFECAEEEDIHFKSLRTLKTQALENFGMGEDSFIKVKFLDRLNKSAFVNTVLSGTAGVTESTRSCIVSVFDQAMRPFFTQNNLINLLSGNDLDMSKIGKKKTAIFLIIPDENTLYHRLVSVFVKQCYTELILTAHRQPSKTLPRRVNFVLDEFATLPPISDFPAMITASRSRNIRFNLIVQGMSQLYDKYGKQAGTISGNCENLVFLHSREVGLLDEIIALSGQRDNDVPLVSASMLQTLNKDKGEAFIRHKRLHPYIANMIDIDRYPSILLEKNPIPYPVNTLKTQTIFDFEKFCDKKDDYVFSRLFSGKSLKEIVNDKETEAAYYMTSNTKPIFTSSVL